MLVSVNEFVDLLELTETEDEFEDLDVKLDEKYVNASVVVKRSDKVDNNKRFSVGDWINDDEILEETVNEENSVDKRIISGYKSGKDVSDKTFSVEKKLGIKVTEVKRFEKEVDSGKKSSDVIWE